MNPRKFKDLHGQHLATIGNYQQDLNTGQLLANQFISTIEQPNEYPELTQNDELKKLIKRLPKESTFNGLIVGFFTTISLRLERLFMVKPLVGESVSQDLLQNYLLETSEYQEQARKRINKVVEQWSINLSTAVNRDNYNGLERYHLSDLFLNLSDAFYFAKDRYAQFCFELTLRLKKLFTDNGERL